MSSKDSGTKFTGSNLKGNTATTTGSEQPEQKKNYDKLLAKLHTRGIRLVEFTSANEKRRKKMLQDEYQDIKNEAGWLYDQPIELPATVIENEKALEKAREEALLAKK